MITIKTFVFNPLQVNTYVLYDELKSCVIIDCACYNDSDFKMLDDFISANELVPEYLINTHGHVDHLLGNHYAVKAYNKKVSAHRLDLRLFQTAIDLGAILGLDVKSIPQISHFLEEGQDIVFGHSKLQVLHVPGHSEGSIALYSASDRFVITGDALFYGSIGRIDFPGGDHDMLINSIQKKLLTLGDDVIVLPGHGPNTSIGQEKRINPYLQ